MTLEEMLARVEHTQLKAFATWEDMQKLCEEALEFHTAGVCVPPAYVKRIRDTYGDRILICTVVGFPLGYSVTAAKAAEVRQALADGCDEIDMVVNIGDVKNGLYDKVEQEIRTLKQICGNHVLKVIVETCYLTREEKIAMCRAVTAAGADYIKTSTGFGTAGATKEATASAPPGRWGCAGSKDPAAPASKEGPGTERREEHGKQGDFGAAGGAAP